MHWLMVVFSLEARATPIIGIFGQYLSAVETTVAVGVGGHSIAWRSQASLERRQLWLWEQKSRFISHKRYWGVVSAPWPPKYIMEQHFRQFIDEDSPNLASPMVAQMVANAHNMSPSSTCSSVYEFCCETSHRLLILSLHVQKAPRREAADQDVT